MKRQSIFYLLVLYFLFILSGCVVRTYPVTKERVDQDLSAGNRGYLKGQAPLIERKKTSTSRTSQVVEIELYPPIKFERMPKPKPVEKTEDKSLEGNLGYITRSKIPEVASPTEVLLQKYTVQKGDTLQKISKQFYGTTKKWTTIYQLNQDILKSPDKLYPGQVINIPIEGLKEAAEGLKPQWKK